MVYEWLRIEGDHVRMSDLTFREAQLQVGDDAFVAMATESDAFGESRWREAAGGGVVRCRATPWSPAIRFTLTIYPPALTRLPPGCR